MRLIDLRCEQCGEVVIDHFQRSSQEALPLCECKGEMVRVHLPTQRQNVIGDDIPGGLLVYNGICHPDGSPKKYYSKSEMRKAADAAGLTNNVRHIGKPGSDRSEHTSRWV